MEVHHYIFLSKEMPSYAAWDETSLIGRGHSNWVVLGTGLSRESKRKQKDMPAYSFVRLNFVGMMPMLINNVSSTQ